MQKILFDPLPRKHELILSAQELFALIEAKECVVFDCRFDLKHPQSGENSWFAAHIPGAHYAHLDKHLAGKVTATSGRHPIPNSRSFASFLARSGWSPGMRIVAYDAQGGAFAARLWWLMKYFNLDCVSILDGGFSAWRDAYLPLESGAVTVARETSALLKSNKESKLTSGEVVDAMQLGNILLLDARSSDRFAGQNETIDPVAGHVTGAQNHPFSENLQDNGKFHSQQELLKRYSARLGSVEPDSVVHMCGSGVTACHNMLAMEYAGLCGSRLYPGSWSEWIKDPDRQVTPDRG